MAKLSLSYALHNKRRISILTLASCLVLVFFLGSMLLAKNPRNTKAAGVSIVGSSYTINNACPTYSLVGAGVDTTHMAQHIIGCGAAPTVYDVPDTASLTINGAVTVVASALVGQSIKLANLTMMGGAILTHNALTVIEQSSCDQDGNYSILDKVDIDNKTSSTCIAARAKKVDIAATGRIELLGNAKIDVDQKGYSGGYMTVGGNVMTCQHTSYGPGRGGDCLGNIGWAPWLDAVDHKSGIGGSFGGLGDRTFGLVGANEKGVNNYQNPTSSEVEFGSGGGAIAYDPHDGDFAGSEGGNGGGRVKLKADTFSIAPGSYITADGGNGWIAGYSRIDITGGGGSGGAIVVDANNIDMSLVIADPFPSSSYPTASKTIPEKFSAIVAGGKNTEFHTEHYGSDGILQIDSQANVTGSLFQMSAQGGRACAKNREKFCDQNEVFEKTDGSGGGGGWIVVRRPGAIQNVSINKTLNPVMRDGASNTGFNPYALKTGDRIKVQLDVVNMANNQTYVIKDDLLTTPSATSNTIKCVYQADAANPHQPLSATADALTWSITSDPTGKDMITYLCNVQ